MAIIWPIYLALRARKAPRNSGAALGELGASGIRRLQPQKHRGPDFAIRFFVFLSQGCE
ncbi:hypothetical protein [Pseudomonas sp. GM_Psu_2]|uniref:hypothetical protein n=1 Tax=unclassified Pseudomonas TaxID=196821 RepID=UPI00226AA951|nr:hypothetical protein [Pseudomonas sp. GM_Psu_2]